MVTSRVHYTPSIFSVDYIEAIIVRDTGYFLVDIPTNSMTMLGKDLEYSRKRLRELGKIDKFPQLINS